MDEERVVDGWHVVRRTDSSTGSRFVQQQTREAEGVDQVTPRLNPINEC
jgi:hypothetical protein